jgi:hypothetical protein
MNSITQDTAYRHTLYEVTGEKICQQHVLSMKRTEIPPKYGFI